MVEEKTGGGGGAYSPPPCKIGLSAFGFYTGVTGCLSKHHPV